MRGVILVLAVGFGLVGASSASAASLSLSVPDSQTNQPIVVTASGSADAPSVVRVFGKVNGTSCNATPGPPNGDPPNTINFFAEQAVPAGSFSVQLSRQSALTGRYLFCGYLVRDGVTDATASASANRTDPPPPSDSSAPSDSGSGSDPAKRYFRAVFYKSLKFFLNGRGFALCFPSNDCVPSATVKVTVDAATRRKLKLTSATIAKGTTKKCGEAYCLRPVTSASVKKKLEKAKSFKVTYVVTHKAPGQPGVLRKTVTLSAKNGAVILDGPTADGSPGARVGGRG